MCGIAGFVARGDAPRGVLSRMMPAQEHRGPDGQGMFQEKVNHWTVGLGHVRLAIIDLSEAASQPFLSSDGRHALVYNGEVYNYLEIRSELQSRGSVFRSDSDAEVVLEALKVWGPDEALNRFNGMWALAWLDVDSSRLLLARDRFGVKPLYYCLENGSLMFASEIKAILAGAGHSFAIDLQTTNEFLAQSLLDASNRTFFEGISKVPPSHYAVVDLTAGEPDLRFRRYWSLSTGQDTGERLDREDPDLLAAEILEMFQDSVRLRLRSDVPVGALLSGGIDSSAIAAAMNRLLGPGVAPCLLSAVSDDPRFDESRFIDAVSRHLSAPAHKVVLDLRPDRAMSLLDTVTWHNDEPVNSFSAVAHYLLMEKARELGVTVVLSGQGGDEVLCGYRKYLAFSIKSMVASGNLTGAAANLWAFLRRGTVLKQITMGEAKRYLPAFLTRDSLDIRGPALLDQPLVNIGIGRGNSVSDRQVLDIECLTLPAYVHYEDRLSMAFSREVRLPFLDYRLVERLVRLPSHFKLRDGWTKWVFRKAIEGELPPEVVWRKDKQGFTIPQSKWLRDDLRAAVLEVFAPDALVFESGLVDRERLLQKYRRYCAEQGAGTGIWFKEVFNPLALEVWFRRFREWLR